MADNKIVLKVVADYDRAIKEWEQLRDGVASTNQEYKEALIEIDKLKRAKSKLTGETHKTSEALVKETKASRDSTEEYQKRKKEIQDAFNNQEKFNNSIGSSSVLSFNNSINATKRERNALIELRNTLDITGDEFVVVSNKISILDQKLKSSANSQQNFTKKQVQTKDATGATTSSVLELGRVISDAPYGIRGMANNLTQLISQLGFASKATGSLRLALKGMWTAMMGPLGIVLAVTAVISLLDGLYGGSKKAEEGTKDLTKSLEDEIDKLNSYKTALDNANLSLEQRQGLAKALSLESKEFAEILKESKEGLTSETDALNKFMIQKNRELDLQNKLNRLREIAKNQKEFPIKGLENLRKEYDRLETIITSIVETEQTASLVRNYRNKQIQVTKLTRQYEEQKELLDYINMILGGGKNQENQEGTIAWYNQQISKEKKLRDERSLTTKDYEKYNKKIKEYEKSIASIMGTIRYKDTRTSGLSLKSIIGVKDLDLEDDPMGLDKFVPEDLSEETKRKIANWKTKWKEETLNIDLEEFKEGAEKFQKALTAVNDFAQAQFDRQLTIEQNKTTVLNEELNKRLLNENLSAEERKNIQQKIWQNDDALRIKQNAIKKKAFNAQKAYNISMAVIDTAKATVEVMAKTPGEFFTKLAAAKLTLAYGLAQVATIASQKFQPQAASTPVNTASGGGGGAGGGVGDRSFDFNLVGATQGNQLLDAIQGQFNKPVQAYVVSRDMTSQQQLDANIKNQASF